VLGDWQSPRHDGVVGAIDPVAPGAASMFLLIAELLIGWVLGLLAWHWRAVPKRLRCLLPLLALMPRPLSLSDHLARRAVRDQWLLAAAIVFAAAGRDIPTSHSSARTGARAVRLRCPAASNALIAAPILAAYIVWPAQMSFKAQCDSAGPRWRGFSRWCRCLLRRLGATRQHPLQSIMVFDSRHQPLQRQNAFPVTWSAPRNRQLS